MKQRFSRLRLRTVDFGALSAPGSPMRSLHYALTSCQNGRLERGPFYAIIALFPLQPPCRTAYALLMRHDALLRTPSFGRDARGSSTPLWAGPRHHASRRHKPPRSIQPGASRVIHASASRAAEVSSPGSSALTGDSFGPVILITDSVLVATLATRDRRCPNFARWWQNSRWTCLRNLDRHRSVTVTSYYSRCEPCRIMVMSSTCRAQDEQNVRSVLIAHVRREPSAYWLRRIGALILHARRESC